jgi:hypothetical protein
VEGESLKTIPGWIARNCEAAVAIAATLVVLMLRLWMGRHVTFCGVPDSCAYLALGQSLSRHHGFALNFLYQYQFVSLHLPTHGLQYWRPGVSFLLLLAQPFGGVTLVSSMVVATLAGVALALAAWKIVMDFSGDRRMACASYLVCLVLPQLWDGSLTADSTLFYGAFAAWFLALFTVRFQGYVADVLALLCVAAVDLIRNDSILLLIPLVVVLWMRWRSGQKKGTSVFYAVVIIVGYVAARAPMYVVNYDVLGKMSQTQSLHVLYLTDLYDLGRYNQPSTLHTMLAEGIVKLVKLRIVTVPFIVYRMVFVEIGFGIVFLFALTLRRRDNEPAAFPELAGGLSFALTVFCVYGLVIPAVGIASSLRSFAGIVPLICVLIVLSIYRASPAGIARRLIVAIVLFYTIEGIMADRRAVTTGNQIGDRDRLVAAYLAEHGAIAGHSSLVMTGDPAQFSETTGYPAIPLPSNGLLATQQAVHDFAPAYVLLNEEDGPNAMQTLAALKPGNAAIVPGARIVVLTMDPQR